MQATTTLLLLLLFLLAVPATGAEVVTLENDSLAVRWDAQRGTIVAIQDKATGRQWLDAAAGPSLYWIALIDGTKPIVATDAVAAKVREEGGTVVVECRHETPQPLTVTCRFRREKDSSCLLGRIEIRSERPCRIAEVRFPTFTLRLPLAGSGEADRLLWPECDGAMLENPTKNRPDRTLRYPGTASLQMMAAFDPAAGLYLAARDNQAYSKLFGTRRRGNGLEMSIAHLPPLTPTTHWAMPYDMALAALKPSAGLDKITWEAAADRYRVWAERQPWCRRTSHERVAAGDIPKWLVEPNLLFTFSLRGTFADGTFGNRLPALVDQVERWSKAVGAPVTALLISWEKLDTWATPDYFPPNGGQDAFRAATERLHEQGHRTMVFLSGLHWTLHKEMGGKDRPRVLVDQRAEFDRRGRASAVADAKGEAVLRGRPDQGIGLSATICPATELAREILVGSSRGCRELGIDCVQVDQIVGGGMTLCLSPKHDHPPGGGNWCSRALYELFSEIRKEGKAADPDFAFSIEEPGEFYLPLLDTYHARDLHQGRWPRSGAGVRGVPLFTHVYHPYSAGYGSEGCYVSERPSRLALYQIGMNLVCGKIPAVALWSRWLDPEKLDPTQRRLLRSHIDLWRGPAGDFLNYGRREASPELDVPPIEMTFPEKDGKTRRPLAVPSVLHAKWSLPDGRAGTVFACIADEPVEFRFGVETIRLEPGEAAFRAAP